MATPPEQQSETTRSVRLLWHACHLCNAMLSQLGAYLSLEALHRDATNTGLRVPVAHYPMMAAQATMMQDVSKNLESAIGALVETSNHQQLVNDPAYRSLQDGAKGLSATMGKLRRWRYQYCKLTWHTQDIVQNGIKSREQLDMLRKLHDELVELCYGSAAKGIMGWKCVWNEVFGFNE